MKKISVIMSVYNNEKTVRRAIDSIINQSFNNLELIICDDNSSDNTFKILEEYKNKYNNIKIFRNEKNMGLAYSLNKCIELSQGEYIARQDGDDYSVENRLIKQFNFLEENKEYDFVGSNVYLFDENGIWGERIFLEKPEKQDFLRMDFNNGARFCHPSIMFRKKALLEIGKYRVAKETRRGQDYDLYMRMYAKGMKGYNIQEKLLYYYEGEQSLKRIPFNHRINSVIIRYKGFKELGLLPIGLLVVLKPIFVGLLPKKVIRLYKKLKYSYKKNNRGE